eukprot:gnl/TRDRNA2_/TRDRNA2_165161_c0_seq1.p3 gnl/TRDRNA2_/TRDRNA2_165161_c0~~gnl/TRDRNA2_/TRDRNA2_165161_c0_seq1.p3  ORF type:complete len:102 (+),score=6.82 gnl/TRDRNA2_/TRDRNA2_165161_c0_seq1:403-708(+)
MPRLLQQLHISLLLLLLLEFFLMLRKLLFLHPELQILPVKTYLPGLPHALCMTPPLFALLVLLPRSESSLLFAPLKLQLLESFPEPIQFDGVLHLLPLLPL